MVHNWLNQRFDSQETKICLPALFVQNLDVNFSIGLLLADDSERRTHAYASVVVEFVSGLRGRHKGDYQQAYAVYQPAHFDLEIFLKCNVIFFQKAAHYKIKVIRLFLKLLSFSYNACDYKNSMMRWKKLEVY